MMALLQYNPVPRIPIGGWVSSFVTYLTDNFAGFFDGLQAILQFFVNIATGAVNSLPALVMIVIFAAIAWLVAGWRVALLMFDRSGPVPRTMPTMPANRVPSVASMASAVKMPTNVVMVDNMAEPRRLSIPHGRHTGIA